MSPPPPPLDRAWTANDSAFSFASSSFVPSLPITSSSSTTRLPPNTTPSIEVFRRTFLARDPSALTSNSNSTSPVSPVPVPSSTVRITVNLPASSAAASVFASATDSARASAATMQPANEASLLNAASRQLPPIASVGTRRVPGHATPPITASGSNRLPVISRRRSTTGGSKATYSKPFPIPQYLRHSSYNSRFFTTPSAEDGLLGAATQAALAFSASASTNDSDVEMAASSSLKAPPSSSTAASTSSVTPSLSEGLLGGTPPGASSTSILLPTCFDDSDKCTLIELSPDGLCASFTGSGKYQDRDAAAVRTNRPIPPQAAVYYFEVTILDKGAHGYIGIGFSHRNVALSRLPGWEDHSWGYHGDDGRAFCCLGTGETYGPTFTTGDVIGCGIDWTGVAPRSSNERGRPKDADKKGGGRAFFVKNGEFLGYAFSNLHGNLYPSVGLRTPGEVVRANFGAEPFRFDIEGLVQERKRAVLAQIASVNVPDTALLPSPQPPIPSFFPPSSNERTHETLQALITAYLIHHGYSATATAFRAQISEERSERVQGLLPSTNFSNPSSASVSKSEGLLGSIASDSITRGEIRSALLRGEPERAAALVQRHYPEVIDKTKFPLETDIDPSGGMRFKLRVRAFVEASVRTHSGDQPGAESDLEELLTLGRELHAEYSTDPRPIVRETLKWSFSLLAYDRPQSVGGKIAWLLSNEAREALADELNSAILASQGLPPKPELEGLYRHTAAIVDRLGQDGAGAAALVNIRDELVP